MRVPVRPVGAPDHSPGRNPGRAGYPMRSNTGGAVRPIRARGPVWFVGAGTRAPRGFAAQGFAPGYGPAALQAAPGTSHSGLAARLGGVCRCAPGFRRPGFRPGLWSTGPTARPGTSHSGPFGYPASFPASAEAVLIGISVRLHLAFASGFLSVCEGKGLYVRRACQYVILRISSRPCTWPECSFYRRPIYCLSAPYASHGVPEIHEP